MEGNLTEAEQAKLMGFMEFEQVKNSMKAYNQTAYKCFGQCVTTFKTKKLDATETACIENCTAKFLKLSQRTGQRMGDYQAARGQDNARCRNEQLESA
ncbi:hypothetical protein JKP88DRAFT_346645 [Tribonema minus]|uniref:Mitochondrial import inner membrane translocase subunit n=1 Tax=Tribonema minus TaxID=303371 RepID=A0A836CES0_9STRA|nr:hypothetical protein JKP88DRAFT_346645 [Tribonema minus]